MTSQQSDQKKRPKIKVSVRRASVLFNVDRTTLARRLAAAFPGGRPGNRYTLAEVFRALRPEGRDARARQYQAQATLLEAKLRERQAMLATPEEYKAFVLDFARAAEETMTDFPPELKRTLLAHIKGIKTRCLKEIDQHLAKYPKINADD
jgi:hypothetical protein